MLQRRSASSKSGPENSGSRNAAAAGTASSSGDRHADGKTENKLQSPPSEGSSRSRAASDASASKRGKELPEAAVSTEQQRAQRKMRVLDRLAKIARHKQESGAAVAKDLAAAREAGKSAAEVHVLELRGKRAARDFDRSRARALRLVEDRERRSMRRLVKEMQERDNDAVLSPFDFVRLLRLHWAADLAVRDTRGLNLSGSSALLSVRTAARLHIGFELTSFAWAYRLS
jgi:hypothetical protein